MVPETTSPCPSADPQGVSELCSRTFDLGDPSSSVVRFVVIISVVIVEIGFTREVVKVFLCGQVQRGRRTKTVTD